VFFCSSGAGQVEERALLNKGMADSSAKKYQKDESWGHVECKQLRPGNRSSSMWYIISIVVVVVW